MKDIRDCYNAAICANGIKKGQEEIAYLFVTRVAVNQNDPTKIILLAHSKSTNITSNMVYKTIGGDGTGEIVINKFRMLGISKELWYYRLTVSTTTLAAGQLKNRLLKRKSTG